MTDSTPPYSYDSYTGNGSLKEFAITFDYIASTVDVSSDPKGIEVHVGGIKQTSGYTIDTSTNKVTFTTAPGASVVVEILRVTPRGKGDRLVDFEDATILTELQLDTSALQLLYLVQESFEQQSTGGSEARITYDIVNSYWDAAYAGSTATIRNVTDPQADDAVATKKYVDDVATWGISGIPQQWSLTGATGTNTFTLTAGAYLDAKMLVVAIDGVVQVPITDYTVDEGPVNSDIVFSDEPENGAAINVMNFGKMRFLDGIDLKDGSVTTAKLDSTAGSEAVTTATIRDANVTEAKIASSAVDHDNLKSTDFAASTNSSTTPKFLYVAKDSKDLTYNTIAAADVSNLYTDIGTNVGLNDLKKETLSMSAKAITNIKETPSADGDVPSKKYVDDQITLNTTAGGLEKIKSVQLGGAAETWTIDGFLDSAYDGYLLYFENVSPTVADSMLVAEVYKDGSGTSTNVDTFGKAESWCISGDSGYQATYSTVNSEFAYLAPMGDGARYQSDATFTIDMPSNRASWAVVKRLITRGTIYHSGNPDTGTGKWGHQDGSDGYLDYTSLTTLTGGDIGSIAKLVLYYVSDLRYTGKSGNINAWARCIVYGRKF